MASRSTEDRLERKREFFNSLDSSTADEDDETPDPGRQASFEALQKAATREKTAMIAQVRNAVAHATTGASVVGVDILKVPLRCVDIIRSQPTICPESKRIG